MAFVYHVELTNRCTLDCVYCALTISRRAKGSMTEPIFRKVVEHMARGSPLNFIILHHFGEPMLHPELDRFIGIAAERQLNPGFSTNGEHLTPWRLEGLIERGLRWLCVTLHTRAGRRAFEQCRPVARRAGIVYWGRRLSHDSVAPDPLAIIESGIEHQRLHTFAGAVQPVEARPFGQVPPCDYLRHQFVCILHDGRVVPCGMDEKGAHVLGTVEDLERIRQQPAYELCRRCQGFQFFDGSRALMQRLLESGQFRVDAANWLAALEVES